MGFSDFKILTKDKLPSLSPLNNSQFLVINLDNSDGSGTHWVALCRHDNRVEYYDSFGLTYGKTVDDYIDRHADVDVYINSEREQHIDSARCGFYCMRFIQDFYN